MRKRMVIEVFLSLVLTLGFVGAAYALPSYLEDFNTKYGTSGTALDTCGLCHVNPEGSGARNPYGTDYEDPATGNHKFNAALEAKDSDGDGSTNIVEINARTFPGDSTSHPAAVPTTATVPTSPQAFPVFVAQTPAPNPDPSLSRPVGLGPVVVGGSTINIAINTGAFAGNVDVYFVIIAPSLSSEIFLLTPAGFRLLSQVGLVPWQSNVTSASLDSGPIPVSGFSPGTYNFYILVTPPKSLSAFYLWQTSFTIGVPIATTLSGAQEVPPVVTSGAGTANSAVDFSTGAAIGTLSYSALSGPATSAHFHQAPAGTNGPVIIPLSPPPAAAGIIPISATLTPSQLTALRNNQLYLNIHTAVNPGGEIRGQILFPKVTILTAMDGSQEVPSVTTSGSATASLSVDINSRAVSGTITYSGLSGPAISAHFHQASAGANGSVIIPLSSPSAAAGTISISTTLTPALLSALAANQLYLNIHTAAHPDGEIRGQIYYPKGAPTP